MSKNALPQHIINAVRRRAAAAEKFFLADLQVSEYCKSHGIDTEFIDGNIETVTRFDPEFFICDLKECLQRKTQKENDA